jgi:hypothetical protein
MFSFFYHIRGGGSTIRALQVSDYLGGRINPVSDYENDTCIYVLGCMGERGKEVEKAYYDLIDCGTERISRIRRHTRGSIIATSRTQYETLKPLFKRRKMFLIPHHHCNFESFRRPERDVKTVGCIGGDSAVQWPHEDIKKRLGEIGLEWRFSGYNPRDRQMVVKFYKTLDIHLTYRTSHKRNLLYHMNPLKLNNAGSFGIPSVSFPEPAYKAEWQDSCLWGESMDAIIKNVKRLATDKGLYREMSDLAFEKASEYHIDKIAPLYKELQ